MKNMIRLMCLPSFLVDVVRDSSGNYLGRAEGDIGYNHFFGQPKDPAQRHPSTITYVNDIWNSLTDQEKKEVIYRAEHYIDGALPIDLEKDFGIPVSQFKRKIKWTRTSVDTIRR